MKDTASKVTRLGCIHTVLLQIMSELQDFFSLPDTISSLLLLLLIIIIYAMFHNILNIL